MEISSVSCVTNTVSFKHCPCLTALYRTKQTYLYQYLQVLRILLPTQSPNLNIFIQIWPKTKLLYLFCIHCFVHLKLLKSRYCCGDLISKLCFNEQTSALDITINGVEHIRFMEISLKHSKRIRLICGTLIEHCPLASPVRLIVTNLIKTDTREKVFAKFWYCLLKLGKHSYEKIRIVGHIEPCLRPCPDTFRHGGIGRST